MTDKYSDYNEGETINKISNLVRDKLDKNSHSSVFVGTEKLPEYFRGNLFKKNKSTKSFKETKTKYFIIIQQVIVGEETKMQNRVLPFRRHLFIQSGCDKSYDVF